MEPYYDDGQVTIYCCDVRDVDLRDVAATVVTSPPYNVGLDYDGHDDAVPWSDYWTLAADAAAVMREAVVAGGRVWVNSAVAVPAMCGEPSIHSAPGKARVMLAHGWASVLEAAGLSLVDQVAWCSSRGAGTSWGSWASPGSPNLRGDYEAITVACRGGWERNPPAGFDDWRDGVGGWPGLCSTVWTIAPASRADNPHPAPFPIELARRCIRLSTWPDEAVFDPFAGSGTTLVAARQLGRRAIGVECSETYCAMAVERLAQGALDFQGAA
jgi:site-specific DNA-methyltransferase (adenine-specific)